jgi:hydroxypyruvate isomerase
MTRYTVNCSILFTELPLLERPAAAKRAGFEAVEFWWPFPTATPSVAEVDAFVRAIEDAGVRLTGLNFAAGDMPAGDRGLVSWPGREAEFRASVDIAVTIGERLGTEVFNALYGNRLPDADPAEQDALAVENLAYAAGRTGAAVLLEPVSGAERYPLLTAADAISVIDKVGAPNVRLLADLYHLTVNGDDVDAVLAEHTDRIAHVQIADAPGRNEPGTGEIDFDRHFAALEKGGYSGWIGLEYKPSTTSDRAFDWITGGKGA